MSGTDSVLDGCVIADAVRAVEFGAITKTNYNKAGNVASTVDARGLESLSLYDERDRLVASYRPPADPSQQQFVAGPADPVSQPAGWEERQHPEALGGTYLMSVSGSTPANWVITLPVNHSGDVFAVLGTWAPDDDNIDDANFWVDQTGIGGLPSVSINQRKRPADYQDSNGRMWEVLLVFTSGGGSDTKLNVKADPGAQADGMMVIEVGQGSIKNVYDAAGQLTSSIDLRGQTTSFVYDKLGRQVTVTLPDPDGPTNPGISPQTEFVYDANGNVLQSRKRVRTILVDGQRAKSLPSRTNSSDPNGTDPNGTSTHPQETRNDLCFQPGELPAPILSRYSLLSGWAPALCGPFGDSAFPFSFFAL